MRHLLNILYIAIAAALCPVWAWRLVRGNPDVGGILSRLRGIAPDPVPSGPLVWLHGASVGELQALRPLIRQLQRRDSSLGFVVSAYTKDGFHVAQQLWPQTPVFYLPFDFTWSVRRVWGTLNPQLLILSELELWPNLLLEAKRRSIPVAVVSCRMTEAEVRFYQRITCVHRSALQAIHWWGAQTTQDADRIRSLRGTCNSTVAVTGSLKFDVQEPADAGTTAAEMRDLLGWNDGDRLLVGGSTHAPEERLLLRVFQKLRHTVPRLHLILVPRHPRRSQEISDLTQDHGMTCVRFSQCREPRSKAAEVTIIDVMGQLSAAWHLADAGFVGGSLIPGRGGQNMIEPALLAKPICFGPHVQNFEQTAAGLLQAGGARQVESEPDMVDVLSGWLNDPPAAAATGRAAQAFAQSGQGASTATAQALQRLL